MLCNVPPDPNVLLALQKKIVFNILLRLIVTVRDLGLGFGPFGVWAGFILYA